MQVEDFINSTSTKAMSSVPVQLLIYVQGSPNCSVEPVIVPLNICLEVRVNASVSFDLYVQNFCHPAISVIGDIFISNPISGMNDSALRNVTGDPTMSYITLTWRPQSNQVGQQLFCATAFTT